ncbi:hypothetical protein NEOLEDRAFT_740853 [Neolentinus lepideus HHB14362 ss-1]|uniref:Zn(2)-C6 fungal-type domain-containing protein n=1 Tax=Neolentinus lepideus HHB14362 ss-1 TaxID=1314782 RepID=A0A165PW01_9AGAM|nr:hypothetical protein NEOLEDRAFT_740853 [Neolentinus lepideus HHB14362 ss-1]
MRRTQNISDSQPTKRRKSRQACVACRKHKTRCETLDNDSRLRRCHRCDVLSILCSFENSDIVLDNSSPYGTSAEGPESPSTALPSESKDQAPSACLPPSLLSPASYIPASREPHEWSNSLTAEALLADRPTDSESFDWIGVPMLAMQELLRRQVSIPRGPVASSIHDTLTTHEIDSLLKLFDNRYTLWLHISLSHMNRHPFLDLVRCMVAARHIEPSRRAAVLPQLYGLVGAHVLKYAFSTAQTIESVSAFLIMSLWPLPSGTFSSDVPSHDSHMIASLAVSAAKQLCLDQFVTASIQLHAAEANSPVANTREREIALSKARLWLSIVSAEWMLCIGTGRIPTSQYSEKDYSLLNTISPATLDSHSRDLRLHLLTRIQSLAQKGLQVWLVGPDSRAVEKFHQEISDDVLMQMLAVSTSIQSLAGEHLVFTHMATNSLHGSSFSSRRI